MEHTSLAGALAFCMIIVSASCPQPSASRMSANSALFAASATLALPAGAAWLPSRGADAPPFLLRCALPCCTELAEAGAGPPAIALSTRDATTRPSVSFDGKCLQTYGRQ